MHRSLSMRLAPRRFSSMLISRRVPGKFRCEEASVSTAACINSSPYLHCVSHFQTNHHWVRPSKAQAPPTHVTTVTTRGICSSAPAWKGRRGGSSALLPRRSRPGRQKVPGEGKKKKPKEHGTLMSRIAADKKLDEAALKKLEEMRALSPEHQANVQKMTEEFLNTPLGQQDVGENAFLRKNDPDAMMLNLGMTLSGDGDPGAISGVSPTPLLPPSSSPPTNLPPLPLQSQERTTPPPFLSIGNENISDYSLRENYISLQPSLVAPLRTEYTNNALSSKISGGNIQDFNLLIKTLGAHRRLGEAKGKVLATMKQRGIRLDGDSYSALLAGAATENNPEAAEEIWLEMMEADIKPIEQAWSSRINAHSKAGNMKKALKLGKEMREDGHPWGVVNYTSLILGCTRKRDYQRAWSLWKEMFMWGIKADVIAYTAMMNLCAKTHQYEMAMTFLSDMDMEDIPPSRVSIETLLEAAATAPQWIRAYGSIVDDLVLRFTGLGLKPEESTYRMLMLAYGSGGDADKVLQCIEEMHMLNGHETDLLGDGTPKMEWTTYCSALDAIAKCLSVGRHRGTRPRFGILPGQNSLVMDITALDVPEDDANRVRAMQMSSIEWDEDGEAELKKGYKKGKRKKFMGVTTPKDLIGDEEFEEDVENEYERVMLKAKAIKNREQREKLIQLGFDPDAEKESKVRPRILPDPKDQELLQAPLPPWLSSDMAPPIFPRKEAELLEGGDAAQPVPLEISDGLEEFEIPRTNEEEFNEDGSGTDWPEAEEHASWADDYADEDDGGDFPEKLMGGYAAAGALEEADRGLADSRKSRGESGLAGGILKRTTMLDILEGDRRNPKDRVKWVAGEGGDGDSVGKLVFPDNVESIMAEMRAVVQEDMDRKARQHSHLGKSKGKQKQEDEDDEDDDDEGEGEEDEGWEEEENDDQWDGGKLDEKWSAADNDPEVEARLEFKRLIQESTEKREELESPIWLSSRGAAATGGEGEENFVEDDETKDGYLKNETVGEFENKATSFKNVTPNREKDAGSSISFSSSYSSEQHDEGTAKEPLSLVEGDLHDRRYISPKGNEQQGALTVQERDSQEENEEDDDDENNDGWVPVMHEGLKDRTKALMGVVEILQADAMAAARRADAKNGFQNDGGDKKAGPAVQAVLRARLNTLTESRKCIKAIDFIQVEYPKEGAKLDIEAALQIVEMYVNTRGVGLAEVFEEKCRTVYGLAPNRRILGTILNARAKRAMAWRHEIPRVKNIVDILEKYKIKPHENELRFVRQLVDKGKFEHSWLPTDPNAMIKKVRLAAKKSKPVSKSFFKVVSKIRNAKFMGGSGRGKSGIE